MTKPDYDPEHLPSEPGFDTICQHLGEDRQAWGGGAAPPIYQNSTFCFPSCQAFEDRLRPGNQRFEYTRGANPTTAIVESKIAALEKGEWAWCFGSGMGAVSAAVNACIKTGDHIVSIARVYYPTRQFFSHIKRFGIETTYVPGVDVADFEAAFKPNTSVLYLESPSSGFGDCPPIAALCEAAHARGIRVILDNSWATPYFLRPLELGCDLVLHSATKFFGGHSDLVAGVVIGRDAELDAKVHTELRLIGSVLDPFAAWLMIRGLRTLPIRMEQHQASALSVAKFLSEHPQVERVYHPALPAHPHHEIAMQQLHGTSSLFCFTLKEQTKQAHYSVVDALKLFHIGVSWGGHESLALAADFFSIPPEETQWCIRIHVGLETPNDLIEDLKQALEKL
jgi:cystathionine beta-lyase